MRSRFCVGAADSENGCACHHPSGVRNRQRKNWPGCAPIRSRSRPRMWIETTPGASRLTECTRRSWRRLRRNGSITRHHRIDAEDDERRGRPTTRVRRGSPLKSVPTASWWANASATARYAYRWTKYHVWRCSLRLAMRTDVTATATNSAKPDPRHEHVGVVRDEVARLRPQRDVVALRVPTVVNTTCADEEPHGGEAGPAVPDREPVEPDRALEPRDARHQQQLHEHRVRPEQRGELPDRGREPARTGRRSRPRRGGSTARP